MCCIAVRGQQSHGITCIENLVKFRHVVYKICNRTDKQTGKRQTDMHTDTLIAVLCWPTEGEVAKDIY